MTWAAVRGRHGRKARHRSAGDGALVWEGQRRPLAVACMRWATAPWAGRSRSSFAVVALVAVGLAGGEARVLSAGGSRRDGLSSLVFEAAAAEARRWGPASPWARASGSGSAPAALAKAEGGAAGGPALEGKPRAHDGGGRRDDAVLEAPGTLAGA